MSRLEQFTESGREAATGATRATVAVLGVLAALAGLEHGVGAVRQGRVEPPGRMFASWDGTPAFGPLAGEPAMTVAPDLLVTGVLAICVSVAVGVTAVGFAGRRHGGLTLIALSLLLLVVGGGFGPPLLGLLAGLLATRIGKTPAGPPGPVGRFLARLWPWPLVATAGCFLALVPGMVLLYLAVGLDSAVLVSALSGGAFVGVAVTMVAARNHDRVAGAATATSPGSSTATRVRVREQGSGSRGQVPRLGEPR